MKMTWDFSKEVRPTNYELTEGQVKLETLNK